VYLTVVIVVRSLIAELRVFCTTHYYGHHCDVYCRPGYQFDCDSSGQKVCRPGKGCRWSTVTGGCSGRNCI